MPHAAAICGTLSRRLRVSIGATRQCAHPASHAHAPPARLANWALRSGHVSGVSAGALVYDQLEPVARGKIDAYLDILLEWNSKMNLTAIKDRPSAISRHIDDSLAVLPAMDRAVARSRAGGLGGPGGLGGLGDTGDTGHTGTTGGPVRIVDVGSGAGLPGLIFAALRPEWSVTLLDSLNKRCTFNTAAAEAMGLGNVDVLWRCVSCFVFRVWCLCLRCLVVLFHPFAHPAPV
jgi:hypothetical protein